MADANAGLLLLIPFVSLLVNGTNAKLIKVADVELTAFAPCAKES